MEKDTTRDYNLEFWATQSNHPCSADICMIIPEDTQSSTSVLLHHAIAAFHFHHDEVACHRIAIAKLYWVHFSLIQLRGPVVCFT